MRSISLLLIALLSWSCTQEKTSTTDNSASDQGLDQVINNMGGPDLVFSPTLDEKVVNIGKNALDLLFVIDNSGSMCEEQERLANAFKDFTSLVYDQFKGNVDYRIAVTSTDIGTIKVQSVEPNQRGAFIYAPADPTQPVCQDGGTPNTMDCPAMGPTDNIISSQEISQMTLDELKGSLGEISNNCADDRACETLAYQKAYAERLFRCAVTLGTNGYFIEKGLEAMRLSLSCEGPNRALFGDCCEMDANGKYTYNPSCDPNGANQPKFLRPNAKLSVVIVSDENDCSTPGDNPDMTSRLICVSNGTIDINGNGIPEVYDMAYGNRANDMFTQDCGNDSFADCAEKICDLPYAQNIECEWLQSALTPVEDYKVFLESLKQNPTEQLSFSALVGFRGYTEIGNPLVYVPSEDYANAVCADPSSMERNTELCCPEGECKKIDVSFSCEIRAKKISAGAGTRYLKLAEALKSNGNGCRPYEEASYDESTQSYVRKNFCLPSKPKCADDLSTCAQNLKLKLVCQNPALCPSANMIRDLSYDTDFRLNLDYGQCPARIELIGQIVPSDLQVQASYESNEEGITFYQSQSCLTICSDLSDSFSQIVNQTQNLISEICLPHLPYCEVAVDNMRGRACHSTDQKNPENYSRFVSVKRTCSSADCVVQEDQAELRYYQDWKLVINEGNMDCPASVIFNEIQPMGSTLKIEYQY